MAQTFFQESSLTETNTYPLDVELEQVFKFFDYNPVVCGIDLNIRKGEFFSILGPSGCGKTTTLRLIAGFEMPSAGDIKIQNQSVKGVPPYRRPVNTVFQSYALFDHLSVAENIAFGLKLKKLSSPKVKVRVQEALEGVRMEAFANRFPTSLSGGQQQRVALARALVNRPAVILLDEPLGALDLKLRKEMQVELSRLHQELGLTFVMVTHDQEEALSLSDRIAVMNMGKIEQVGSPSEIYELPQTPFVADFIGDTNLFEGKLDTSDGISQKITTTKGLEIITQSQPNQRSQSILPGQKVVLSIRPEKIKLSYEPPTSEHNCFSGHLQHVMYLGTHIQYVVELDSGDQVTVQQTNTTEISSELGQVVYAYWSTQDCLALPEE